MPRRDGTGPDGVGPTGRRLGNCNISPINTPRPRIRRNKNK